MLFLIAACTEADVPVDDPKPTGPEHLPGDTAWTGDTAVTDTAETGETGETAETADSEDTDDTVIVDTGPVEYDCSALPSTPLEDNELDGPKGYHDLEFDASGNILGQDGNSLARVSYDGDKELWVPGIGTVQGIARLPDGDYAVGSDSTATLLRVSDAGGTSTIAGDLGTIYGVMVGPDGKVYVSNNSSVYRVDPDTGASERLLRLPGFASARQVAFSLDNTTMYISSIGAGVVYSVPVDETLTPAGDVEVYAEGVGVSWHDGLDIDACGNLYVPDYSSSGLYRVNTDRTVTTLYAGDSRRYGHGLLFGNGVGGWRKDALYLPQPYDSQTVREVVIGVPSGASVRTPF